MLARGARLTEVLKQDQFKPYPFEEQVVSIYTGVKGHLDSLDIKDVTRFEQSLLDDIRSNGADILATIRSEKDLSDETEAKLKAHIETFLKSFS